MSDVEPKRERRRYRKIDPYFWNDEKVRRLSDDGKFGVLFLLTHPHLTALGAMRGTLDGFAAELGWRPQRFRRALEPAIQLRMIEYDARAAFIAFPNFLRYNDEGSNSVKYGWPAALALLPECAAKARLVRRCAAHIARKPEDYKAALGDDFWRAFPLDAVSDAIGDGVPDGMPDAIGHGMPDSGAGSRKQEQEAGCIPPDSPPKGVDWPGFAEFWNLYPKHREERAAIKAWNKLRPSDELRALILTAVRVQATWPGWTQEGGRYIPHASKWLSGERWKDEARSNGHVSRRNINAAWERPGAEVAT